MQEEIRHKKQAAKSIGNQSLIRGLRLLDLLSNFPNGCPLAQLAKMSQLNKSTTHRLLQGLQSEGFIQTTAVAGSYRLSTKCLSLGQKTLSSLNIINIAAPHLERLNLTLGETINFSKREGNYGIMIYKLEPTTGMLRTRAYIGQHLPLYCSAMGKLYLAYEKDHNYLAHYWQTHQTTIEALTHNTIITLTAMEEELTEIRRNQFAMDREENELGVGCIASPVFNLNGTVEYAISVSSSIYRLKQLGIEKILAEIRLAARAISRELGWKI